MDANDEYDRLDKEQKLKAAMFHGIKQIAKQVEEDMSVTVSAQVIATLSETLSRQAELYALDLENFAKHARRTNINVDDVHLLARRNAPLAQYLSNISNEKTVQQVPKKKRKVAAKRGEQSEAENNP